VDRPGAGGRHRALQPAGGGRDLRQPYRRCARTPV